MSAPTTPTIAAVSGRIIRFLDPEGTLRHGTPVDEAFTSARVLEGSPFTGLRPTGETVAVAKLLAPVAPPNILGIGLNYRRHAEESGMALPERPLLFIKPTTTLTHPGDPIIHPGTTQELDYECELAVVIGRTAKNVSESESLDYVLGYTCANDVSARDWQLRYDKQWARGKSFDTFCPLGPVLVTPDLIPDPNRLRLQTRVNGETLQDSTTADMIFSVREIIASLSANFTLLPGTVILTGTPEGVGMGRKPQRWLAPGDVCEIEIETIGILQNHVQAGS
jgi:2-keto-4-pentenoate hydratase/2-oxohepta-3-ene-1,7-dioic acid hydratase in catechol pathway